MSHPLCIRSKAILVEMNSSMRGSCKFNKFYQRLLIHVWFLQDQSHSWLLVLLICVWFNKPRHKATLAQLWWVNWMHEESLYSYFTTSIHSNRGADWRVKTSCSCFHKQFLLFGFAEQQLARDGYMFDRSRSFALARLWLKMPLQIQLPYYYFMHAATAGAAVLYSTVDLAKVLVTAQQQSKMSGLVKFTWLRLWGVHTIYKK